MLTSFGRVMSLTAARGASGCRREPEIVELDVTDTDDLDALAERVGGRLDGVLHAIGFAPESCLGGGFLDRALGGRRRRAAGLGVLAEGARGRRAAAHGRAAARSSASTSTTRQAWPVYDWMGVAKAALESTARYLARDLGPKGIRVNLVAAGPIRTIAASSIPGFEQFEDVWVERAPLGWDVKDPEPVAKACVALLSDLFPATTGEIVHVDGGFHAVGA